MFLLLDEPSQVELEKKESTTTNYLDGPSTSKSLSLVKRDNLFNDEKQTTNNLIYFMDKDDKLEYDDVFYNTSPSVVSNQSHSSFSENSVDFSSDECLSNDVSKNNMTLGLVTIIR